MSNTRTEQYTRGGTEEGSEQAEATHKSKIAFAQADTHTQRDRQRDTHRWWASGGSTRESIEM